MTALFTNREDWSGGFFELALEFEVQSTEQIRMALTRILQHRTLNGCYLRRDVEPLDQVTVNPAEIDLSDQAYSIADIPDVGQCFCVTFIVREDHGSDWLILGVPMGSLSHILPVGAFPFDDETDLAWRDEINVWLCQIAEWCYEAVPFQLGLIGFQVSGYRYAVTVRQEGIPSERWIGYLWPSNKGLGWFAPTV